MNPTIKVALFPLITFLVLFGVKSLVLGPALIKLPSSPPLTGVISQGLGISGDNTSLPVEGKDYTLKNTLYFDNRQWVVTTVIPAKNNGDVATVVLEKINGVYQIVVGPGTDFSPSYIPPLPQDVTLYLTSKGVLNGQ
jgi:hypothetical protein